MTSVHGNQWVGYRMDMAPSVQSNRFNPHDSSVKPGSVFMEQSSQNRPIMYAGVQDVNEKFLNYLSWSMFNIIFGVLVLGILRFAYSMTMRSERITMSSPYTWNRLSLKSHNDTWWRNVKIIFFSIFYKNVDPVYPHPYFYSFVVINTSAKKTFAVYWIVHIVMCATRKSCTWLVLVCLEANCMGAEKYFCLFCHRSKQKNLEKRKWWNMKGFASQQSCLIKTIKSNSEWHPIPVFNGKDSAGLNYHLFIVWGWRWMVHTYIMDQFL